MLSDAYVMRPQLAPFTFSTTSPQFLNGNLSKWKIIFLYFFKLHKQSHFIILFFILNVSSPRISHAGSSLLICSHYRTTPYRYFLFFFLRSFLCILLFLSLLRLSSFLLFTFRSWTSYVIYSTNPTSQPVAYIYHAEAAALFMTM
jgi:hypothetical protein